VPFAGVVQLAGLNEQLIGVLAHRLEEPVSRSPRRALHDRHQRLVDQAREQIERQCRGDGTRGLGVEPAYEHGEVAKRPLLGGLEQLVAPLDRRAECAVMRGREAVRAANVAQARLERAEQFGRRHHVDVGGGKLDGER
jgi:hypothetical protein